MAAFNAPKLLLSLGVQPKGRIDVGQRLAEVMVSGDRDS